MPSWFLLERHRKPQISFLVEGKASLILNTLCIIISKSATDLLDRLHLLKTEWERAVNYWLFLINYCLRWLGYSTVDRRALCQSPVSMVLKWDICSSTLHCPLPCVTSTGDVGRTCFIAYVDNWEPSSSGFQFQLWLLLVILPWETSLNLIFLICKRE